MRKLLTSVFLLTAIFAFDAQARIATNTLTDYTVANQGILPNTGYTPWWEVEGSNAASEGYIVIMGLNIEQAQDPNPDVPDTFLPLQRFHGITVEIASTSGDRLFEVDSTVLTNSGGTILAVTGGVGTLTVNQPIPVTPPGSGGNSYYIAIRTTDNTEDRSFATFSVAPGGVAFAPAREGDVQSNGVTTNAITCELRISDLMPLAYDNIHDPFYSTNIPEYPPYYQWQPGEMIRPRYDRDDYEYAQDSLDPSVPFEHRVPQVLPWETRTAVLGIACAQRNVRAAFPSPTVQEPGESLSSVTITVTAGDSGAEHFDPNKTFRTTPETGEGHGITLWRDNNQNGVWDPEEDSFLTVAYSESGIFSQPNPAIPEWTLTLYPTEIIDDLADDLFDYFVVIEQRSDSDDPGYNFKMGQDYKIWIQPGQVTFGPIAHPVRYAGIDIAFVKKIYNNIYLENLAQHRVDPVEITEEEELTYNIIPVIGINIASGGTRYDFSATKLQSIDVELLSVENFDPRTDLAPLTGDASAGLSLWRDTKESGNIGSFDAEDTFIPTNNAGWVYQGFEAGMHKYTTTLVLGASAGDEGMMYPFDYHNDYPHGPEEENRNLYRGIDFYLAIKTSQFLSYGSIFKVKIPQSGIWTTYEKTAQNVLPATSREIKGNVFSRITSLTAPGNPGLPRLSDPTPLFKVELEDNDSGKTPWIEGLTVEFYDRGNNNFNLNDLASFNPLYPNFDGQWFNITYFNTDALKECGVVFYRDEALTDPVMIGRYRPLYWLGHPMGYQFEFLNPVSIPSVLYAAIRTSGTFTPGDSFDAGIVGWGLNQTAWNRRGSRAVPIVDIDGLKTTTYARCQSGIFNPSDMGNIYLSSSSEYDYVKLEWVNSINISPDTFVSYEIIRDGEVIAVITDINQTWYEDSRDGANPPLDGVDYEYSVNIVYTQGGAPQNIESNLITTRLLSFADGQMPGDFSLAPGTESIMLSWVDRSYNPEDINTFDDRATSFFIRRTYLKDGSEATFEVATQFTQVNPYNIWYEYFDGPLPEGGDGTVLQPDALLPGTYVYELYMVKNPGGADSESKPVIRSTAVHRETDGEFGAGGCFIATAVYGTEMAPEVATLKSFRDNRLMKNTAGRAFVRWYYRHSPPVADFIRNKSILKAAVRAGLKPLIWFAGQM